jgi:hypothetical protein
MEKQKMNIKKVSIFSTAVLMLIVAIISIYVTATLLGSGAPLKTLLFSTPSKAPSIRTQEGNLNVEIPEDATFVFVGRKKEGQLHILGFAPDTEPKITYRSSLETMLQLASASKNAYAKGCLPGYTYICGTIIYNGDIISDCGCVKD